MKNHCTTIWIVKTERKEKKKQKQLTTKAVIDMNMKQLDFIVDI